MTSGPPLHAARRTVAVVLAGGTGTRIGGEVPKQLLSLGGRPMLEHAVAAFDSHPLVDEVVVLMAAAHVAAARAVVEAAAFGKVAAVLEGGDTRSDTTRLALDWAGSHESEAGTVLLHDAARPLVSARIISDCVAALAHHDAVTTAIPSADTLLEVGPDTTVVSVPRRSGLWRAQTPQGFTLSVIRRAHQRAAGDPEFEPTDDCSVVVRYLPGVPVAVVPGDERNLKVTTAVDLDLAERLLGG